VPLHFRLNHPIIALRYLTDHAAVFVYETWASLGMVMVHPEYPRIRLANLCVRLRLCRTHERYVLISKIDFFQLQLILEHQLQEFL
jgi:hypothetical protein